MTALQLDYAEVDPDEYRMLLRASPTAFIEFMIPDVLGEHPPEDFHLLTFSRFIDLTVDRDAVALPRDHAKTTYLRLAFVYLIFFSPLRFFVPMGPEKGAAAATLQVIWGYLNDDNVVALLAGPLEVTVDRQSEGHMQFYCHWWDEKGVRRKKHVILKAQGAQQAVRGMNYWGLRPQFVGCDDIENEDAVRTIEGYQKFKAWFDNVFMRAVSREAGLNKVVQIGNLVGMQTLLADNLADPDWRSMRFGILRNNGQPLWAARFSLQAIRKSFLSAQRRRQLAGWFAELMNAPLNVTNSLIAYEDIHYSPRRSPADGVSYAKFITIDPAGDGKNSDDFAIVLHTIDPSGIPQITEYHAEQSMTPEKAADKILELCVKWDCHVVGCESVRLQKVFLNFFRLYFGVRGRMQTEFVPVDVGRAHKTARLRVFAGALACGEYTLCDGDWNFVQQLLAFDTTKETNRDDLIDAGSQGLYMLKHYNGIIEASRYRTISEPLEGAIHNTPLT